MFDLYGYRSARVLEYLQNADAQAVNILKTRAARGDMSSTRCHKAWRSEHLWQLTTDNGSRFLYFRDGARDFIFVGASCKVKEKKFYSEIERAERLRTEYLELKKGKVR